MEKQIYIVQFDNGIDRRSAPTLQPDEIFAAIFGQEHAPNVFSQSWNRVVDQREWKIVVRNGNGRLLREEPARSAH